MKEKHPPNLTEKILVTIFPFLAEIMRISTSELKSLTMEDPVRAEKIAMIQTKIDNSSRQEKKSRLS